MASSPPPPGIPILNMPKKRSSTSSINGSGSGKRRKPSNIHGPSHLREQSFPPASTPAGARSPSGETSSLINGPAPSVFSTATSVTGGGRKRKGKKGDRDARSVTGSVANGVGTQGGKEIAAEDLDEEGEDDDDEEGDDDVWQDQDEERENAEHARLLIATMDREQNERYETFRRVRLKKEFVRKIVNQTLSQSVPGSVVTSVNAYTKTFIGELIDRARQVQAEYQIAASLDPSLHATSSSTPPSSATEPNTQTASTNSQPQPRHYNAPNPSNPNEGYITRIPLTPLSEDAPLEERMQKQDRGPLTPDHLREALRRYKKDKEGVVGFGGLSLEGRERTAARMGGRRLFR